MVKEQREEHKMKKLRVGVIGIGDISNVYLNNLKKYDAVEVDWRRHSERRQSTVFPRHTPPVWS